jgi:hypothetical protein
MIEAVLLSREYTVESRNQRCINGVSRWVGRAGIFYEAHLDSRH